MKSQISLYRDIYKYSTTKAMFRDGGKSPFGCERLISGKGSKRLVLIYVGDEPVNLDEVRFEDSGDKDLIYRLVSKSVKKKENNIRFRVVEEVFKSWAQLLISPLSFRFYHLTRIYFPTRSIQFCVF